MPRWKVLISAPHAMPAIARYRAELGECGCELVVRSVEERLEEEDLLPLVSDVDGIICGDDRITRRVLEHAPRLRVISKWGTGTDSIDRQSADQRGVVVCNTPDAFSEPVADTVLGYILLFARQLDHMAADMRSGLWRRLPLVALGELTLGVVGAGACGRAVIRRATSFGMRILVNDVRPISTDSLNLPGVSQASLDTVLENSDFVSLHTPLTAETLHLLDKARLAHLKPSAILINTSRGGVVDETALIDTLREGRLAGAALDVFEQEPLPPTSPLRHLRNVYLAPHSANISPRAADRVHANTILNLLRILECTKS